MYTGQLQTHSRNDFDTQNRAHGRRRRCWRRFARWTQRLERGSCFFRDAKQFSGRAGFSCDSTEKCEVQNSCQSRKSAEQCSEASARSHDEQGRARSTGGGLSLDDRSCRGGVSLSYGYEAENSGSTWPVAFGTSRSLARYRQSKLTLGAGFLHSGFECGSLYNLRGRL